MSENVIVEVLAAHADHLVTDETNGGGYLDLFPDHRTELAPLLRIAERVKAVLVSATLSPEFEAALKQDLLTAALQRSEEQQSQKQGSFLRRRGVLIGAAVGSALSVAGIVAALVWWQRSIARA